MSLKAAEGWLRARLAAGPVPEPMLRVEADAIGWAWRDVVRARRIIAAEVVCPSGVVGGGRWWRLPQQAMAEVTCRAPPEPEVGKDDTVVELLLVYDRAGSRLELTMGNATDPPICTVELGGAAALDLGLSLVRGAELVFLPEWRH